jgi:hypothetical protein
MMHYPNATNKRPNVADPNSGSKEVVKIESYCEMPTIYFVGEGDIERISLSGKFRRARMA